MMNALTMLLGVAVVVGQVQDPSLKKQGAAESRTDRTPTPELRIDSGAIRGLAAGEKKDVYAYKGIPYAAPPVGELRFKPPQPVAAWKEVRDCFEFGPACPQKIPALFAS